MAIELKRGACEHRYNPGSGICELCRVRGERDVLQAEVERLRGALVNVRDNYDHDEDAHRYRTICRACDARAALDAASGGRG